MMARVTAGFLKKNLSVLALFAGILLLWGIWLKGCYFGDIIGNDDCLYMDVVRNIARGDGITSHTAYPAHIAHHRVKFDFPLPFLVHAVLFPVWYAPAYRIMGHWSSLSPYVMNALFFLVTQIYVYRLGLLLAGPSVASLAVFVASLEPLVLGTTMSVNTQPSFTMFLVAATYYLFRFYQTPGLRGLVATAVLFTLSQYCRVGTILCFIPMTAAILLRDLKQAWRDVALFLGICGLLLAPWGAWMYYVTGTPFYSPYYIAFDYVLGPGIVTSFMLKKFTFREMLAHFPALVVWRQLGILKDIYRETFNWMNPIVFAGAIFAILSRSGNNLRKTYGWFCAGFSLALLWPGYLASHVYPIIFLWSVPAAMFIVEWLGALPKGRGRYGAAAVLGALLLQPWLTATFGARGIFRGREETIRHIEDWRALGDWLGRRAPSGALIYSNASEWVAWYADRNVLFLGQDEKWTRASLSIYPSDWILLADEDRRIGGSPEWNDRIRRAVREGADFMGFKRVDDFRGRKMAAGLFRREGDE